MRRIVIPLAVAGLLVTGCGTKTIDKDKVAAEAQEKFDALARSQGQASFPKITCPDDLKAEVGEKTRCSAKGTDGTLGITVTVKSVDGDNAKLDFQGDDKLTK